jgi:hypothetical protein
MVRFTPALNGAASLIRSVKEKSTVRNSLTNYVYAKAELDQRSVLRNLSLNGSRRDCGRCRAKMQHAACLGIDQNGGNKQVWKQS